ncbi:MAG: ATP-binding protein [Bacteroidales bacterium]|nr:ATP-binding protein [Bacteroidales bacterium]
MSIRTTIHYAETLILKKDNIEQHEQEKYLGVIYKNCNNLQELVTNLFEHYFKKNDRGGSSGLGLAIVKRIIDLHESTIDVKSVVGKGTSFQFSLPVANIA